jgi:hypothetical protein
LAIADFKYCLSLATFPSEEQRIKNIQYHLNKSQSELALQIAQQCLLGIVDPAVDRRKQS